LGKCQVLFAGGIHDAKSAAMVAALAGPLAERGAKIGALLGTAYLFTKEAVDCGAITRTFQSEALRCSRTVLLESGPGHATRCAATPYFETFEREKERLAAEGQAAEETRAQLEALNLGRLRIATKGIARNPALAADPALPKYVTLPVAEQRSQGMYMVGQVASLRNITCSIAELHHDVAERGAEHLDLCRIPSQGTFRSPSQCAPAMLRLWAWRVCCRRRPTCRRIGRTSSARLTL